MKADNPIPPKPAGNRRGRTPVGIPQIPMEWMDPMSWRLPSGKALAEFALQAGFLAPLMLGAPKVRRGRPGLETPLALKNRAGEAPESPGSFRETR